MVKALYSTPINSRFSWIVIALGVAISIGAMHQTERNNALAVQAALRNEAAHEIDAVIERMSIYRRGLEELRVMVAVSGDSVNREKFARYVNMRNIDIEFPGARGFGLARRVPAGAEEQFIAAARADHWPDFAIQQFEPYRGEHFIIEYIEPADRNRAAIGLDLASEPRRRAAALDAMHANNARLTAPLTLLQASALKDQSVLLFLPIYNKSQMNSEAERAEHCIGWTYTALIFSDVLEDIVPEPAQLHLILRDITDSSQPQILYASAQVLPMQPAHNAVYAAQYSDTRILYGRTWQFEIQAQPDFIAALHLSNPLNSLAAGLLLSLLSGAVVGLLINIKQRRDELIVQQKNLAMIVDNTNDAIVESTLDGIVTAWSQGAEKLFGFSATETIGRKLRDFIVPPELKTAETAIHKNVTLGDVIKASDAECLHRDGYRVDFSATIIPKRDAYGKIMGMVSVARDLSVQKAFEQQLHAENAELGKAASQSRTELNRINNLLQGVLSSATDIAMIATNRDGIITLFNPGAENMLGYSANELIGKQSPAILHVESEVKLRAEELSRKYATTIAGFQTFITVPEREGTETREWTYLRKNGTQLTVNLSVTVIRDEHHSVLGYLGIAIDITERKDFERRLVEALAFSKAVLNTAVNPIITIDTEGCIRSFNPAAEKAFGYSASQAIGRNVSLLMPAAEGTKHDAHIARYKNSGISSAIGSSREVMAQRADGSTFPVQISLGTMQIGDEQLIVGVIGDMTDYYRQRKALLEMRDQLSLATDAAELGIFTWEADKNIVHMNQRALDFYQFPAEKLDSGVTLEELHARQPTEFTHAFADDFREAVNSTDRIFKTEGRIIRADGTSIYLKATILIVYDDTQRAVRFLGVNRDVTEQIEHEAKIRAARDQMITAIDAARLGVWSWQVREDTMIWNDRMFDLYQQSTDLRISGVRYKHWRERIHPEDLNRVENKLLASIRGHEIFDPEFRLLLPDNKIRYVQASAIVERDDSGKANRVTGFYRDVTTEHEQKNALRWAKEQADAASKAKSEFLANMSHEIRTPMNAVLGMLQLVTHTDLDAKQRDYIEKANGAARTLLNLLSDVLDFSKIEAGKLELDNHPFSLEHLLRELALVASSLPRQPAVELLFDIEPNLPDTLVGDSLHLHQVLLNLCGNAVKFTEHGNIIVKVQCIDRNQQALQLRFSVSDTGIGISHAQQKLIFESFTQAENSTTRRFGGSGLGLTISQQLVQLMGSRLTVASEPGKGSEFSFVLELPIVSTTNETAVAPDDLAQLIFEDNPPLHVLIVDDNAIAAQIMQHITAAIGWRAQYASNGNDAISAVSASIENADSFDAVFMDWRMPDMDGLSCAAQIKAQFGDAAPAIIMVTAHEQDLIFENKNRDALPFSDFISKPITAAQLIETVERVLHGAPSPTLQFMQASQKPLTGLRILVVEDNALNRQIAQELLTQEGAAVEVADSGNAGVDKVFAAAPPFDVVLMDMQMPDIDGLAATQKIRSDARFAHLPIMAMTANVSAKDREACLAAGMNAHIGKPFDIAELVMALLHVKEHAAPVVAPAHAPAALDPAQFTEPYSKILARLGNNKALYEKLLAQLPADMEIIFAELAAAMQDANNHAAIDALHTIKGSAANIGATALAELAAEHEHALKNGSRRIFAPSRGRALLTHLRELLANSLQILNRYRDADDRSDATVQP